MTVHTQRIEVRHRGIAVPDNRTFLWLAVAIGFAMIALAGVVLLQVLDVVPNASWALVERLEDLRVTVAGGGFI